MLQLDLNKSSGISLDLKKEDPALKNLKVLLNWDEHPVHKNCSNEGFDLDLAAFALNAAGKIDSGSKVIYFNNMSLGTAIVLPRDNRTGAGADDEEILFDLSAFPADVDKVAVYATIHEATKRNQHFGMVANANVQIINSDTSNVIAKYNMSQDCNGDTAIFLGMVDRNSFTPDGGSGTMDLNGILGHYT